MFTVGKLTDLYRKQHGIKQKHMCSFATNLKPDEMFEQYSYTSYYSLAEAIEELDECLCALSEYPVGEALQEKLDYLAYLAMGIRYLITGFDCEDDDYD